MHNCIKVKCDAEDVNSLEHFRVIPSLKNNKTVYCNSKNFGEILAIAGALHKVKQINNIKQLRFVFLNSQP